MGGALVAASEEGRRHRLRKSSKERHDHDEIKLLRPASAAPPSDERSCGRILVDALRCGEKTRPGSIDGRPLQRFELYVAAEETRGSAWSYFAAAFFTLPLPPPRQEKTEGGACFPRGLLDSSPRIAAHPTRRAVALGGGGFCLFDSRLGRAPPLPQSSTGKDRRRRPFPSRSFILSRRIRHAARRRWAAAASAFRIAAAASAASRPRRLLDSSRRLGGAGAETNSSTQAQRLTSRMHCSGINGTQSASYVRHPQDIRRIR
jgi:hypothetical protein